jgi:hypothetical protein
MAKYDKAQLETIWRNANPGLGNPRVMAAIALAESSGEEGVVNSIGACGLWQIHPYQTGCQNAMTNAKQAGEKLRTQGLTAWQTYTEGKYQQYLGTAGTSSGTTPSTGATSSTSSSGSGLNLTAVAVKALTYLALLFGGGIIVWLGAKTLLQPRQPVVM